MLESETECVCVGGCNLAKREERGREKVLHFMLISWTLAVAKCIFLRGLYHYCTISVHCHPHPMQIWI